MSQAHNRKLSAATFCRIGIGILSMACTSLVHADDGGQFYGLLRSRDLSPFGFLRLDMRPAHAVSIEPGSWALETEIGYQNTWALSPEVEKYLTSLEPTGRRRIGPAEVQAIQDLPGENYLLDIESALQNINNTPDIDLQLGFAFVPHIHTARPLAQVRK